MVRKAFFILVVFQGACTAGPDQLGYYRGPAVVLSASFADPPASEIRAALVDINQVNYCNLTEDSQPNVEEVLFEEEKEAAPFVAENLQVEFLAAGYMQQPPCGQSSYSGSLRFFEVDSVLEQPGLPFVGHWAPIGYYVVYATSATTFSPLGPAGPTVDFPRGYSWLRRTCGTATGVVAMDAVSTSETVEFHYLPDDLPQDRRAIELSERNLVESCGVTVPADDLGSRISFDRAQSLVWAADGASLYYLPPADATDPTQSVGLRQVRLADSATSELAVIPSGQGLQIDVAGQLYVGSTDNLMRVVLAASGPASLVAVPVPANAVLSPDGRWLAYTHQELHVWDVQAAADRTTINGSFLAWSPDSALAYRSLATDAETFDVLSPAVLGEPKIYGSTYGEEVETVGWNTDGPLLARSPFDWSIENYVACQACFGLSLQDPSTGAQRQVLDASAGKIDIVSAPPVLGFMLVWARTCLGLYNTVCSYSLLRVDLTDGTARPVAVAAHEYPVAVSPDNQRIAIASPTGIYVKSLVQ